MPRIRFDFGTLVLDAELFDTPTARLVVAALPATAAALAWRRGSPAPATSSPRPCPT
jgi:Cyclophilin-like